MTFLNSLYDLLVPILNVIFAVVCFILGNKYTGQFAKAWIFRFGTIVFLWLHFAMIIINTPDYFERHLSEHLLQESLTVGFLGALTILYIVLFIKDALRRARQNNEGNKAS